MTNPMFAGLECTSVRGQNQKLVFKDKNEGNIRAEIPDCGPQKDQVVICVGEKKTVLGPKQKLLGYQLAHHVVRPLDERERPKDLGQNESIGVSTCAATMHSYSIE